MNLNNYSEKTVRASGQTLDYGRTDPTSSGNIAMIDSNFLQQLQENKSSKTDSSRFNNNTSEFPGLGAPEANFSLISKKKKNKKPDNNKNNKSSKAPPSSSLSSIANLLGTGEERKESNGTSSGKVPPRVDDITPLTSKLVITEPVSRPSKQKPSKPAPAPAPAKPVTSDGEDFPTLGGPTKKLGANFVRAEDKLIKPPSVQSQWATQPTFVHPSSERSLTKPPPGFSTQPHSNNKTKVKVPPGFKERFVFFPPEDFQERNVKLISTVSDLLGGKSAEFKQFRDISGKFRSGEYKSEQYFGECSKLISRSKFTSFFPELLVLLPDIPKQTELLSLYLEKFPEGCEELEQCSTCSQVVLNRDATNHSSSHKLDSDFPVLG